MRNMSILIGLIGVLALANVLATNAANTYTVGGDQGWAIPSSVGYYDQWANNVTLEIGDTVVFNWTGTHTATEVGSVEEYNNCTKMGIILATSGVQITFNQNGTHYFVCSVDNHCELGQKVIIKVGNGIAPPNSSSKLTVSGGLLSSFLLLMVLYMF